MQWACPLKKLRRWTLSNQPEMVETMCRAVRKIGHECNKLVKAWDPDFTKATPEEAEEIKKAEESGFVDEADIDWDNLQQYAG